MSLQQISRIERYLIALGIFTILTAIVAAVIISKKDKEDIPGIVNNLRQQNETLIRNNSALVDEVKKLNRFQEIDRKQDSTIADQIRQNALILPQINRSVQLINEKYETSINRVRNFNDAELADYVSAEANRIRAERYGASKK